MQCFWAMFTRNPNEIDIEIFDRKQVPMLYDGDLHQHDRILTWLTSQDVFEIKNEIEEVNRKMLDKLLEENEFLAVYFCRYFFACDIRKESMRFKQIDFSSQMKPIIRTVHWCLANWRISIVRPIIWTLHSLKCQTRGMHENGV